MKWLKWIVLLVAIEIAVYAYVRSDVDRSLWVLNAAIKIVTSPEVITRAYGDKPWQKLDVYVSPDASSSAPVLVFIHGGGWHQGRKEQYLFVADAFLRLGYTVVLPDYVKYPSPNARFPAHITDAAQAVSWVKNNIATLGGNPNALFVAGHSAGAHTAALLATDMSHLKNWGVTHKDILAVAPIAGPFNFTPDSPPEIAVFGPESNYSEMDPLKFVNGDEPALLVLHSDGDETIANHHPRELEAAMKAAQQDIVSIIYSDYSHEDMLTHLHPWFAGDLTIAQQIDLFFKARLPQRTLELTNN